jgi:hypothetical protein
MSFDQISRFDREEEAPPPLSFQEILNDDDAPPPPMPFGGPSRSAGYEEAPPPLGLTSSLSESAVGHPGMIWGDPYAEQDLVTRQVPDDVAQMFASPMADGFGSLGVPSHDKFGLASKFEGMNIDRAFGDKGSINLEPSIIRAPSDRFKGSSPPPAKPGSNFFRYNRTTMFVDMSNSVEAANDITKFFEGEIADIKVNTTKWTIRVDGFVNQQPVGAKVRMYDEGQQLAIEFQRRSGDALQFGGWYRACYRWLERSFRVKGEEVDTQAEDSIPPAPEEPQVEPALLAALVDDLAAAEDAQIQRECVTNIHNVLQRVDLQNAINLMTAEFRKSLARCLHSDQVEVAYPTAVLVSGIAKAFQQYHAQRQFYNCRFMDEMLNALSSGKSPVLQKEISDTLNAICRASPDGVDEEEIDRVSQLIQDKIDQYALSESFDFCVRRNLEECVSNLRRHHSPHFGDINMAMVSAS